MTFWRRTTGLGKRACTWDSSVFRVAQLYTVTDLQGITWAWVHWHNTSRFMHPIARARAAGAGHCARRRDGRAGLSRMTRCTNSGAWPG